jgi:hypothetical protein
VWPAAAQEPAVAGPGAQEFRDARTYIMQLLGELQVRRGSLGWVAAPHKDVLSGAGLPGSW